MFDFLAGARRSTSEPPPVPAGPLAIWMTCVVDGREHGVTDEEVARGSREGGTYVGVCGHLVVPGSMTCPPGRRCRDCHAVLAPSAPTRRSDRRRTPFTRTDTGRSHTLS